MKGLLDPDTLLTLGLQDARFSDVIPVPLPPPVAEGRMAVATEEVPLAPIEPSGIRFYFGPKRLRASSQDGAHLEAVVLEGDGGCLAAPDETEVVFEAPKKVVIRRVDGRGVVLAVLEDQIQAQVFSTKAEEVTPFADLDFDLRPVTERVRDNMWLCGVIESYSREPWHKVKALGVYLQYWTFDWRPRDILASIRAGEELEGLRVVRNVLSHWDKQQLDTVVRFALADIFQCQRDLDFLEETFAPTDPDWVENLVALCHMRDDLDGLRELLGLFGRNDLDESLKALDEEAWSFIPTVPAGLKPDDERLLRALARNFDVWWVWPVRDPGDFELFGKRARDGRTR